MPWAEALVWFGAILAGMVACFAGAGWWLLGPGDGDGLPTRVRGASRGKVDPDRPSSLARRRS